jgi:glutathione reductase (NADPH)
MGADHYDLCVLGGGSGGVRAARVASQLGARVALVEAQALGGTCVNVGCVPKKLFVYAAAFADDFDDAAGYGWTLATPSFDWSALIAGKDAAIMRLRGVYQRLLVDAGVCVFEGWGRLSGPRTLRVGERELSFDHLIVATGASAFVPDVPGAEHAITSDAMFSLPALPESIVVVGGGFVALEFAGLLCGLGVRVLLVHRGEHLLSGFDEDLRTGAAALLRARGVDVRLGTEVTRIDGERGALDVTFTDGSTHRCGEILFATGRRPHTADAGLIEHGVKLDESGAIVADPFGRTSLPHVCAVGDVRGGLQFTPLAVAEGQAVAEALYGDAGLTPLDRGLVPTCVFTRPEIATVGLTEDRARERGPIKVYRGNFRPLRQAMTTRKERSLVKLVVDAQTDRVLGVHVIDAEAAEIIQGFAVAVRCGATHRDLLGTIGIHPTSGEELLTLREPSD